MTHNPSPTLPPPPPELGQLALDHVRREEEYLDTALEGLHQLRAALLGQKRDELTQALAVQDELARANDHLQHQRDAFRRHAAALLNDSPTAITLGRLAERLLGEEGQELARRREVLSRKASEMDHLNRNTAGMTYYCLDFLQRFLMDLTRGQSDGRYSPAGHRLETTCGSLIESRG